MSTNKERAAWAEIALQAFSNECGPPIDNDPDAMSAIGDLVGDLMHYCERRFKSYLDIEPDLAVNIVAKGIGMWSAERRCVRDEPYGNDEVDITITLADQHGAERKPRKRKPKEAWPGQSKGLSAMAGDDYEMDPDS